MSDDEKNSEFYERVRELRIPLVIELDDAALRALVGMYRESNGRDADVNTTNARLDGERGH